MNKRHLLVAIMTCHLASMVIMASPTKAIDEGGLSSSSPYTSIRALDEFGDTVQLKHAREAALRHGRLVVAAANREELLVVSVGKRPLVSSLTLPFPSNDQTLGSQSRNITVAMCCTGVKSDADWLTRHMQGYISRVWERYDLPQIGISALAHWLARLLGSFQDDGVTDEWQSSIARRIPKGEELEYSCSRPLGVQAMLLSTAALNSSNKARGNEPAMLLVETTGRVFRPFSTKFFSYVVAGKHSEKLKDALLRLRRHEVFPLEDLLVREMLEVLVPSKNEITDLVVERIGEKIETFHLQYRNNKLVSRMKKV